MAQDLLRDTAADATRAALEEAESLGATSIIRVRYQVSATVERIAGVRCAVQPDRPLSARL
jgi:uncharacterized protein YbjQ (UPF0145 family)